MTSENNCNRFFWLDLIRFIAAFVVVLSHSRNDFFCKYASLPVEQQDILTMLFFSITRLGYEAVMIFFVLSGYLVGGRGIEKILQGTFGLKNYVIDRGVRILLPLASAVLLHIVVSFVLGEPVDWFVCVGNLLSLQEILVPSLVTPFWSLAYEVWFYIVFGSIAALFLKNTNSRSNLLAFVVFTLSALVFIKLKPHYLFMWLMGAVAYFIRPDTVSRKIFWGSLIFCFFSLILLQMTTKSTSIDMSIFPILKREVVELVFAFFCCLFFQQIVLIKPLCGWSIFLDNLGTKLAAFSYTLYLVHRTVFLLLFKYAFPINTNTFDVQSIIRYVLFLAIVVFSSYCVYFVFERNTQNVKRWVKARV